MTDKYKKYDILFKMNIYIKQLVESYFDSTEQMNSVLKDAMALMAKEEKLKDARTEFIQKVLGKTTYKRFENNGLFAPVPLNAIQLTRKDFDDLYAELSGEKTDKLFDILAKNYGNYDMVLREDSDMQIKTNLVFKTIDDIINFFYNVLAAYKRVYRSEDINWKPIVRKFREYLR